MREEKGISLIKLIIIVAIIILIATISFSIINNSYKNSELDKYISQMQLIQENVNMIRNEYKVWEDYNPNEAGNFNAYLQSLGFINANSSNNLYLDDFNSVIEELNNSVVKNWDSSTDSILANYFYFTPQDLEEYLGIKDTNLYVIINFYTGNVISKDGIYEENKIIHRQYDSKFGNKLIVSPIYNSGILPQIEIVENYGLSQKIRIFLGNNNAHIANVYYYISNEDDSKKLCNNFKNYSYVEDENAVYFNIDVSAKYTFIIEDTNFVQYPKIEFEANLCNPPILLEEMMGIYWDEYGVEKQITSEYDSNWYNYSKDKLYMANAKTVDGNYWVWLPRYLYKETTEGIDIEFVNGTTTIPTNNKILTGHKVQEAFSEEGEFEGIWIAKFQVNVEDKKINIKPGKTLNFIETGKAIQTYENLIDKNLRKYSKIMSEDERTSILNFSNFMEIDITNDLVHYAGGSPNEEDFKENVQYSSSNNVSGIYDLITSENEITIDSKVNEEGRFRGVIKISK